MDFENYMERLKEDIDLKADKFEHIDYYDALLRDGNSKDTAVAASELHELDERRKPLISVNTLFAKVSGMPPAPSIEDITYEHISLNLPIIAKNALIELDEDLISNPKDVIAVNGKTIAVNNEIELNEDDKANDSDSVDEDENNSNS